MAKINLEQRVTALEAELRRMKTERDDGIGVIQNNWKKGVEKYVGDTDLQAVFQEAKKLRDAERKRVHQPNRKRGSSQ